MSIEWKGPQDLQREVADRKLCARCGACLGMCPYRATHECRIVVLDECSLSQGRCYAFCPRASVDLDELSQKVFGVPQTGGELGVFQRSGLNNTPPCGQSSRPVDSHPTRRTTGTNWLLLTARGPRELRFRL